MVHTYIQRFIYTYIKTFFFLPYTITQWKQKVLQELYSKYLDIGIKLRITR